MSRKLEYRAYSDSQLLDLLRKSNHGAFTEIYLRNWSAMYLYARKLTNDEAMSEDVVQEVMLYIWNKREELPIAIAILPYMYTSIRHNALRKIERGKYFDKYLNSLQDYMVQNQTNPDEAIHAKELSKSIQKAIDQLPRKMKLIFELSRVEHLSQKSIAEKLNISERTVKNQITTALKILRLKINHKTFILFQAFF